MASAATPSTLGWRLASFVVSLGAALVILGVSIVPFLTPMWIHAEQDRADSAAWLGGTEDQAHRYSDSIVHDLVLGGDFVVPMADPACFGRAGGCGSLLDSREQSHMRDVRGVFQGLALLVLAGAAVLAVTGVRRRRTLELHASWWRAVSRGGAWLATFMVVVGILSVVAFDAMFQAFHELLFPAGSFTFDPATERLVQLYPDRFWSETTLVLGVVALGLSLLVAWIGRRRAARLESGAAVAGAAVARSAVTTGSAR